MSAVRRLDPAMVASGFERNAAEFYPEPPWVIEALLKLWRPRGTVIWDPACGTGTIPRVFRAAGYRVVGSDLYPPDHPAGHSERAPDAYSEDFFLAPLRAPTIVCNPPYSIAPQFVRHAVELTRPVGGAVAMLLRHEWMCAGGRADLFGTAFAGAVVLTKRPRWIANSTGSPRHPYTWLIWDHQHRGDPWIRFSQ